MKKYLSLWLRLATHALQEAFVNRASNVLFFVGKSVRFGTLLLFLLLIRTQVKQFGLYTSDQLVIFFMTYQLVDLIAQIFFRGVYMFREKVRTGEFDFFLVQPMHALFRALFGKPDINDVLFLVPMLGVYGWLLSTLELQITLSSGLLYLALVINGLLIATAFHILVLALGIVTTEVDNAIMFYRDLANMGRFPVTIYPWVVRMVLFFVVPVGMMMTIPAEVLLGVSPSQSLAVVFGIGISFFVGSLWAWRQSLKYYTSASS